LQVCALKSTASRFAPSPESGATRRRLLPGLGIQIFSYFFPLPIRPVPSRPPPTATPRASEFSSSASFFPARLRSIRSLLFQ
uniref:Uncharacterized protein n=1 Tax=Aegilops tauschii subsp. strangulata TaxID=200361 RepID=A0A453CVX5_AEGTS